MIPPFIGALVLLGTVAGVTLAVFTWFWASGTKNQVLARRAAGIGGGVAGSYALIWVLGLVLTAPEEFAPGRAICFGGLDCHLHVSVAEVQQGDGLAVTVKFFSNAKQAPEWPGALRYRLRDASGREYPPTNAVPDAALAAGETRLHELQFPGGVAPAGAVLIVTWKPGLDYLVPGAGNPLVQSRRRLALAADLR
jgi:hypothetical protein